jgi:3-hydroxymyristoyl/3-hydroxydecanoyl-(acyl carrier protein) dehydratase
VTEKPALPHHWPFRFVDVVVERSGPPGQTEGLGGKVRTLVSANGRAASGEAWGNRAILAEALAQAAFAVASDPEREGAGGRVFLGGIRDFVAIRPPRAGESLEIDVRMAGAFGAVARFDGEVRAGQETLARGSILVHRSAGPEG